MSKEYFNIGMYDNLFSNKTIEKGIEIYLSNNISKMKKEENTYYCKIQGTELYDVSITFISKNKDQIENINCTCPYSKDGYKCKHMYALLLRIKSNYDLNKIEKIIKRKLKELKNYINENDREYLKYKYRKETRIEIELFNNYMIPVKNRLKLIENKNETKENTVDYIIILKDIIKEINGIENKLKELIVDNNIETNQESESIYETKQDGLLKNFVNMLDSVNKEQEKRDNEYEEERERYRRTIIEQNIYEGKTNEDIYDGLDD